MVTPPNIEHEVEPCLADLCAGVVGKDLGDILPLDPTQRCVSHALGPVSYTHLTLPTIYSV